MTMEPIKEPDTKAGTIPGQAAQAAQPFVLTPENYYSKEANQLFLSNSQFKAMYGYPGSPYACESSAMFAPRTETEALLVGSYVDAAFESDQALAEFKERRNDALMQKSKKAYYKFVTDADKAIARARLDPVFMSYLDGSHQTVLTGEIAGHAFRIKMDAYKPGVRITDLKYVKSSSDSYNEFLKRRVTFIEDYGYHIQGAIYQEIEYQNSGTRLPFYIAYITKEDTPDIGVVEIPQDMLDDGLEYVKLSLAARPVAQIRKSPRKCGRRSCTWCRDQKSLTGHMAWPEFEAYCRT